MFYNAGSKLISKTFRDDFYTKLGQLTITGFDERFNYGAGFRYIKLGRILTEQCFSDLDSLKTCGLQLSKFPCQPCWLRNLGDEVHMSSSFQS